MDQKIKVLMLSRHNLYQVPGGDTVQVENTAKYLREMGVDVTVGLLGKRYEYNDYDIVHFFNIIIPEQIMGVLRKLSVPYVVSTIFVDYSEYESLYRHGLPGAITRHLNPSFVEYGKAIIKPLIERRLPDLRFVVHGFDDSVRRIASAAAMLLPNSESENSRFTSRFGVSVPYHVVPNGVDHTLFKQPDDVERDEKLVLCVARIEGLKNQLNLIRAVAETDLKLKIIGNPAPNHQAYYQECIESAGPAVEFLPHVTQEQLVKLYSRAKVHVLPSWFETTGLVSLEAGLMGCNIVVSDRGDVRDYFGSMAFYCDPGSVESIRRALVSAADTPTQTDLVGVIREKFSWIQAAKETRQAYMLVLQRQKQHLAAKKIAFFHQSAELYGSDRVLIDLVKGLDRSRFSPVVLLPRHGPLFTSLIKDGVRVYVIPMVTLRRSMMSLRELVILPFSMIKAIYLTEKVLKNEDVRIVHSNTLAVLSGALWAKIHGVPHLWHVHEIILRPRIVSVIYSYLLSWFSHCVVCNSVATREAIVSQKPSLASKSRVIWNGIKLPFAQPLPDVVNHFRHKLIQDENTLLVVLVGRINRWKGQQLLVSAASVLWGRGYTNIQYLIVGDAPEGQEHFVESLKNCVAESPARERIHLLGFRDDVPVIWKACDIAVIPSTDPEPFGMVSIEAMAFHKPVVAAGHGGLAEIIKHGVNGLLFRPSDVVDFADKLQVLIDEPQERARLGEAAFHRVENCFTLESYIQGLESCYEKLL
jgi:glycosyltransferase involved in cell wall biosynthesis